MCNGTDIFWYYIAATLDEGVCTGCLGQVDGGTGRAAEGDELLELAQLITVGITGGKDDIGNILFDLLVDIYLLNHLTGVDDLLSGCHGLHLGQSAKDILTDNHLLFLNGRIVDDHLQHESVDLCFGQRIGTFLLDGVLGSHDQERVG